MRFNGIANQKQFSVFNEDQLSSHELKCTSFAIICLFVYVW